MSDYDRPMHRYRVVLACGHAATAEAPAGYRFRENFCVRCMAPHAVTRQTLIGDAR